MFVTTARVAQHLEHGERSGCTIDSVICEDRIADLSLEWKQKSSKRFFVMETEPFSEWNFAMETEAFE